MIRWEQIYNKCFICSHFVPTFSLSYFILFSLCDK
nr:MAG TPA: hypothetical protein [Caudoviricetes sp.]